MIQRLNNLYKQCREEKNMAKLSINLGTNPNDGTGDNLRGGGT